jgi:TrmH family RNA methyltransferase
MNKTLVRKLNDKKYRNELGLFLVQGEKNVLELLSQGVEYGFVPEHIFCTPHFFRMHDSELSRFETTTLPQTELESLGTLETNGGAIAVVRQRIISSTFSTIIDSISDSTLILGLDAINDPGNLGTILRIADWYGISHVVASPTTVDFYNPKVILASMGSFLRVRVVYAELAPALRTLQEKHMHIYVTAMSGTSLHTLSHIEPGVIVMGSESHGVSKDVMSLANSQITIPKYGSAESLNVSVATGIILDTFKRLGGR